MSNKSLYDELSELNEKQRQEIKNTLSLSVSQALRILRDGRRLSTLTKAKYGYYLNKFRPIIVSKKETVNEALEKYNDYDFFDEYMLNNKLEEF